MSGHALAAALDVAALCMPRKRPSFFCFMATVGACWCSWAVAAMRRLFSQLIFWALVTVSTAAPAVAEKRIALVIGNSAYKHAGVLTNPKNDATDMSAALK